MPPLPVETFAQPPWSSNLRPLLLPLPLGEGWGEGLPGNHPGVTQRSLLGERQIRASSAETGTARAPRLCTRALAQLSLIRCADPGGLAALPARPSAGPSSRCQRGPPGYWAREPGRAQCLLLTLLVDTLPVFGHHTSRHVRDMNWHFSVIPLRTSRRWWEG